MTARPVRPLVSRVAASLLGGYAFVWGFTTLGIALGCWPPACPTAKRRRSAFLLAFLVFLVCFLLGVRRREPARACGPCSAGGGAR